MRTALEHDIAGLRADFLLMLGRARNELALAGQALLEADAAKAERVVEADREVDELQTRLERLSLELIARHQPVAGDLRLVAGLYASLPDLERVGDYAVHVAADAALLARQEPLGRYPALEALVPILMDMADGLEAAVRAGDAGAAALVVDRDRTVDAFVEKTNRDLVDFMVADPGTIVRALALLRVARSLQRVGDHLENVAERAGRWLSRGESY